MFRTVRTLGLVCCVLAMACSLQADIMDDAVAWYKLYDGTVGSSVVSTQIIDSTGTMGAAYSLVGTTPTWATCDATREGFATVDDRAVNAAGAGGIKLFQNGTSSMYTAQDALYGTHTNLAAAGSFTVFTRVYVNEGTYSWDSALSLLNNYAPNKTTTGAAGFSFRLLGSSTESNPDADYVRVAVRMGDNSSYSTLVNNGLTIKNGEWADVAFSYDSVNGKVIISAYDSEGFESVEFDYSGMVISSNHFTVATSLNSALSGYGSYLPGSMESFAMWNTALTSSELQSLSIPEPATLALLGFGAGSLFIRRKK